MTSATLLHKLLAYVCSVPDDGVYAGVLYQERNSLIKEAQTTLAEFEAMELPPIGPHDRPEPETMMWSRTELAAIEEYRRQAFAQGALKAQGEPFGWIKQSELDRARESGGSINLWLKKHDCDIGVFTKELPE
jgi:hypothetical protein